MHGVQYKYMSDICEGDFGRIIIICLIILFVLVLLFSKQESAFYIKLPLFATARDESLAFPLAPSVLPVDNKI